MTIRRRYAIILLSYKALFSEGVQLKVLQKLPGHNSFKTTMDRYAHLTANSLRKDMERFEKNNQAQNGVKLVSDQ